MKENSLHISELPQLNQMHNQEQTLYFRGDLTLLKRPLVSMVGSRNISNYARSQTSVLAQALSKRGVCVVSGAALGVDSEAHKGATPSNTIAVLGNGLDIRYPRANANLIASIEQEGLVLSQFEDGFEATRWSFVVRNELVVALGDVLVIAEASLKSGTMTSADIATKMGKEIWVLPHRLGESEGTQKLIEEGRAKVIADIEAFVSRFGRVVKDDVVKDEFLYFCQTMPSFESAVSKFGSRVYEAELGGLITVEEGRVRLC